MTASTTATEAARDGTPILTRRWASDGSAWASILLVHGIGEHSGRYERVGRQLAAAGLDVHAYDQRGFGASGGRRAFVERWSQNHDDLEDRLRAVRAVADGRPVAVAVSCSGCAVPAVGADARPSRRGRSARPDRLERAPRRRLGVVRRTWPNLRHESHNEPEGTAVIADVIDWLRKTLAPSG